MDQILETHILACHGSDGDAYVHGFLCGLQCNPVPVAPTEWLDHVLWNGARGEFDSKKQVLAIVTPLVKEWDQLGKRLDSGRPGVMTLIAKDPKSDFHTRLQRLYLWTAGFFDAAYLDDHDFIGKSEGDQSAIAFLEMILSAGVQRGFAGEQNELYGHLQSDSMRSLLRDELMEEMFARVDTSIVRAFRHFRGIDPIYMDLVEE